MRVSIGGPAVRGQGERAPRGRPDGRGTAVRITVHEFMSLDGVVQGPGAAEEDPSGGFTAGGWVVPLFDEEIGGVVDSWFRRVGAFLYGRTTYGIMKPFWSQVTDPDDRVATAMNTLPKYVVSGTLGEQDWHPTTVLPDLDAVRALRDQPGDGELQVHGSGRLAQGLHAAGLVDEFRIITFPVVLGRGKRLFDTGTPAGGFDVVDSRALPGGVSYVALTPKALATGAYAVQDGREVVAVTAG